MSSIYRHLLLKKKSLLDLFFGSDDSDNVPYLPIYKETDNVEKVTDFKDAVDKSFPSDGGMCVRI